jgi:hypothetical protein
MRIRKKQDRWNFPVYQSNAVIQSRKHFGIIEHRLFRLALADLRPKLKNSLYYDEEFRPFHMTAKEVLDMFQEVTGGERHSLYERLLVAHRTMIGSYVEIGTAKDHVLFPVFERIKFSAKEGLSIQFHKDMRKLLLDLEKGNYTRTFLRLSFSLSSTYSLILLELMLQYQGMKKDGVIERDLTVEELRFSMDVPENAYDGRMNNFRKRVIDAAIAEINEKTDYYIEPKYGLNRGKYNKVTGFHFVLHLPQVVQSEAVLPAPAADLEERLKKYGVHWKTARRLAEMPQAEENLAIALKHIDRGEAKNPAAYIKSAIEQDWNRQREAMQRALEEEKREREDKKKWDRQAHGIDGSGDIQPMQESQPRQEFDERELLDKVSKNDPLLAEAAEKLLRAMRRRRAEKRQEAGK